MLRTTLILTIITAVWAANDINIVKTKNGLIEGTIRTARKGREFVAFEGVPYAKPPVGKLRFKEPEAAEPWTGVWKADTRYECMQIDHNPDHTPLPTAVVEGTEDCLYVNVYTPVSRKEKLLDVIVHIHGGAFMFGQGDLYGPNNLLDRDVVYVSLNYRLGALGFLSTEDEVVPGNNGLKDQSLALKWIKNNIQAFGGNPKSVTITGLSAGGASVHYHYLSPLSKGLFQRGVSWSGTALMNWALVEKPFARAKRLGELVGCNDNNSKGLVECLRRRSAKQIVQAVKEFQPWLYNPYTPFGPVVEEAGKHRFLEEHPYKLLKNGKVQDLPWITSVTTEEGLYPAAEFIYKENYLPHLDKNWEKLAKYILHYEDTILSKSEEKKVTKKIKEAYLKNKPISRETYPELVQMIGDRLFVVDAEKAARLQAKINKSPVYFYVFSYRGGFSTSEYLSRSTENVGVCHADDVMYIVSPDDSWYENYLGTEEDNKMADLLLDLFTGFAKTGVPSVPGSNWSKVLSKENINYLHIKSPNELKMEETQYLGRRDFWDSLPFHENNKLHIKDEL